MAPMKISNAIDGYWLDKRLDLSNHTIGGYVVIFRRLIEFLQDKEIEQVTSDDIRRFLAYVADEYELSAKSLSNVWTALSSLWSWAEKELGQPHALRNKIKRPKYTKPVIETFTQDEIRALLKAAEYTKTWAATSGKQTQSKRPTAARDKAIILTLLDSGIRAQELCNLTVGDYDDKRGRLHIRHGKGNKQRFVILGNRARKAIWKSLIERGKIKPAAPLFATQTAEHLQRDNLRHTLERIGERAAVVSVHPHRFRHTFAINFLRNGGNVLLLKELLGHESIEMVMHYARIADQDIDRGSDYSPADHWRL